MLSKFDYSKCFLTNDKLLICPLCKEELFLEKHSLRCNNKHTYNISKKGTVSLVSHSHVKESKIYNYDLFYHRRQFIQKMFYQQLYDKIVEIINKNFDKQINIVDLGCGEGTHTKNILDLIKIDYMYYGLDYSKTAIDMASYYNSKSRFYFVADVNNIPIENNSIDLIIDILSPYNNLEIKRLLKHNGIFVKVAPGENYLKELRIVTNISEYNKNMEIEENLSKNFKVIKKEQVINTCPVDKEDFLHLLKMSPMYNNDVRNIPETITFDLIIYIVSGEEL